MPEINRAIVIVLDGVGIGEAPDAEQYGDVGSNSIANTAKAVGGLALPNMGALGLGCITAIEGVPPREATTGAYGKMRPMSAGKDTISGHWELMGIYLSEAFPLYPHGFPPEVIGEFERRIGRRVIGNKHASGTEIIEELGEEHIRTGYPIVYTSADSVFQIAAHEEIIPIEELYHLCQIARAILTGRHGVGRVIARPFLGEGAGKFWRTERRRDYPLEPPDHTTMDNLIQAGKEVVTVGKIDDIFAHRGITDSQHTTNNPDSIEALLDIASRRYAGLLFANLIEFDMVYGHRNDPHGYAAALRQFDDSLPELSRRMAPTDMAVIVSDHGVDPTTPSTDHSREYAPLLVFGEAVRGGVNLGVRRTYSDVAATIAEIFALTPPRFGESFLAQITG